MGKVIAPQVKIIGPTGLEPPAWVRNMRKDTVKHTKNRPLWGDVTKGTILILLRPSLKNLFFFVILNSLNPLDN